jgi:hypothetical protein
MDTFKEARRFVLNERKIPRQILAAFIRRVAALVVKGWLPWK